MAKTDTSAENLVWQGRSSQILNLGWFVLGVLLLPTLIVPILVLVKYLRLRCRVYEITSERLRITSGILSKKTDYLELYRVKDMNLEQPFTLRLFGLGNVVLLTSDKTTPDVTIPAVAQASALLDQVRSLVEACRRKTGTREVDFADETPKE